MLPQLADLDKSKLSPESRRALEAAVAIHVDGVPPEQAASDVGMSVAELRVAVERLGAEWQQISGVTELPRLTQDEYDALKESIGRYGQIVPILCDADGKIVDGRARARVCEELGRDPNLEYLPATVGAEELKGLALAVNLARRQVSAGARRGFVRSELLRDPSRSDRAIAGAIGVSPTTVGAVRRELEQNGQVSKLDTRVGSDGVAQPASKTSQDDDDDDDYDDNFFPTVDLTVRLLAEAASELDGDAWVNCKAFRLRLIGPGMYTLEVRR